MTRYAVRPASPEDAERLGVLHTAVWREAYAGVMPADFLAALDERAAADRWRAILGGSTETGSTESGSTETGSTESGSTEAGRADMVLVATADDVVVGFASTGPSRDDPPEPALELQAINVLAAHHGTGVAAALLDAALAPAAGRPVSLWVADGNTRALAFYSRSGFVADGLTKRHAGTGITLSRLVRYGSATA